MSAVNAGVQIPVSVPAFTSFEYMTRSGISGSNGNSMFNLWRNFQTLPKQLPHVPFQSAVYEGSSSPHPRQHLLLCLFDSSHPSGCDVVLRF